MKVVVIGGFCEIFELCRRAGVDVVGYTDPRPRACPEYGVPYLGLDEVVLQDPPKGASALITPDDPALRGKIGERFRAAGLTLATVVAQTADVSPTATLGEGAVVAEHAVVNAKVQIGRLVKINTAATVMHECEIGDGATIAPRAVLLGRVKVGPQAYIGANATILPGVTIGAAATIGAGAVVTHDVPADETWAGVPARRMKTHDEFTAALD